MAGLLDKPGLVYGLVVLLAFVAVALWEQRRPLAAASAQLERRWACNFGFLVLGHGVGYIAAPLAAAVTALLAAPAGWGLLPWLAPGWLPELLLTLIALDLARWGSHCLLHRWTWLWRIHQVHHSDREFDCTVGVRFHPLEVLLHAAVSVAVVLALGPSAMVVVLAEALFIAHNFFCHANAALPARLERALRHFVVTPDLHRVHHGMDADDSARNFGTVLTCWDRWAGTLRWPTPGSHGPARFGVSGTPEADTRSLWRLLLQPLRRAG